MIPELGQDKEASQFFALAEDNEFLAVLTPNQSLNIICLRNGLIVSEVHFTKTVKACLSEVQFLRWAPDVIVDHTLSNLQIQTSRAWILLAGSNRLVVLELDILPIQESKRSVLPSDAKILADYQFDEQYGKIFIADFVFNHNQLLVTFDTNTHASLISATIPERKDIPSPKFRDYQGFAQSNQRRHFALLCRSSGQDQVVVFTSKEGIIQAPTIFLPRTIDCQGLRWSPNNDPVLVIWDSAVYGLSVSFFTALGHPLKQLDLRPESLITNSGLQQILGTGVTSLKWMNSEEHDTLLAAAVGGSKMLLRKQNHRSLHVSTPSMYSHKSIIDGSQCHVWQQVNDESFEHPKTVFEVRLEPTSEVNLIEMNADASVVATRTDTMPKTVWLWKANSNQPAGLISLANEVKKVLWHPLVANVLIVLTNEKRPCIYICHNLLQCPQKILVPLEEARPTSKWTAEWVAIPNQPRCPFFISSKHQFDIGLLSYSDGEVFFKSMLRKHNAAINLEDDSILIDTPSKPEKTSCLTNDSKINDAKISWHAAFGTDEW